MPEPPRGPLTFRSRLRDLYARPVGRDVVDKILYFSGVPPAVIRPLSWLRLGTIDRLTRRVTGPGLVRATLDLVDAEPDVPTGRDPDPGNPPWWRSAVFYQIYPRSFADSNGDGIGDLLGIVARLDHLERLGVDCLWLSPVFDSPNQDMGYDIRDYRAVAREMGTLADLDALIDACHARGMRIVLDLVVNHTSDQHEWFRRALTSPDAPENEYYIIRDGPPERRPNNWLSFFSGPAWRRLNRADGSAAWALHLFHESQPDLNWENPRVRREVADIVRWWLDRGVDGFRLDVINYISKPPGLPDGHPFLGTLLEFVGIEHYFYGPRLHEYLSELRREGFTRPDGSVGVMIGETPGIGVETGRLLAGRDRGELDMVFDFDVLEPPGRTRWDDYRYRFGRLVDYWIDHDRRGGPGDWFPLFVENHDNPRMVSKILGADAADPALRRRVAQVLAALQLTMRGTPFIYQGQELGAVNEPFTEVEQLRDVESVNRHDALLAAGTSTDRAWAEVLAGSRDHARTPLRWTEDQDDSRAWLPGHERTPGFSVHAQDRDPGSVLAWYRDLLALRRAHPALMSGSLEVVHRGRGAVTYRRRLGDDEVLVELCWGNRPRGRTRLPGRGRVLATTDPDLLGPGAPGPAASLPPWSATVSTGEAEGTDPQVPQ